MKILNMIEIKKVEKKKPATAECDQELVDGVCPEDGTPVENPKPKKKLGRKILCAAGAFGAGAATAFTILARKGAELDEETETGADEASDTEPFEETDEAETY